MNCFSLRSTVYFFLSNGEIDFSPFCACFIPIAKKRILPIDYYGLLFVDLLFHDLGNLFPIDNVRGQQMKPV